MAHRFARVIAMAEGRVAEQGTPAELAGREDGAFSSLLQDH